MEGFVIQTSGKPSVNPPLIVLKPKLRAPVPRPDQLVRRELLERLHAALERKVSVVSAPTGYGKTTLLAHWRRVEEAELPFAWVSLDEQDDDRIRLWRHIVEALRGVLPEGEEFAADVLASMSGAGRGFVETTLPLLINELAELSHRVVVVLDDYQFVTGGTPTSRWPTSWSTSPITSTSSSPAAPTRRCRWGASGSWGS